ncbi:MAG: hypothetical protein L0Y45_02210 [Woeseiaceae bacterium]|nr:hypothetical protein [Woeseiaceae bacterium]
MPAGFAAALPSAYAAVASTGVRADMIVTGGRVWIIDPAGPRASALAVRGDRLLAVGTDEEIESLAGPDTERVNAAGRTVVPGFIDAHCHPLGSDEAVGVNVNLPTIADVREALAREAAETPH